MAVERLSVALPDGFDSARHTQALIDKAVEAYGAGWEVADINLGTGKAMLTRPIIMGVTESGGVKASKRLGLNLPKSTKPSDGDKIAAQYEADRPGFYLTSFEPYLGKAELTELSDGEARARGAIAQVLGTKPWDVTVSTRSDGGYTVGLPPAYVPSKHDAKLEEVATVVVGRPGWYITIDPEHLTAQIIPGKPPTFPPVIPYKFDKPALDAKSVWRIPVGMELGKAGHKGEALVLDMDATPGALIVGTAGGGKSVTINSIIAGALARGWELCIGDVPHKKTDFLWCQDFCRPYGWGCDSPESLLTMLKIVYEEKERRAELLERYGAQKIQDLPDNVRPPQILIVLDEVTGIFALEPEPKSIPKDHPLRRSAMQKNLVIETIKITVSKIPAELRFVGIRIILSTQMAQSNTGISVPLKTNLANRMLLGSNPNEQARGHAFLDPRSVPTVPDYLKADPAASRGVGSAEFEGHYPTVFKSFYASTDDYRKYLLGLGVPRTDESAPTPAQVKRYTPSIDDGEFPDDGPVGSRLSSEGGWGERDGRDAPDPVLKGAAAAAHALKVDADTASRNGRTISQ